MTPTFNNHDDRHQRRWQAIFDDLAEHLNHSNGKYPRNSTLGTRTGRDLKPWFNAQRNRYKRGELSANRARQLETLPHWEWDTWQSTFDDVAEHVIRTGRHPSERSGIRGARNPINLGGWLRLQRIKYTDGTLPADRARQLETLPGWSTQPLTGAWTNAYNDVAAHLTVHLRYPSQQPAVIGRVSGVDLGQWLKWQRLHQRRGSLTANRARQLETLPDWQWNPPHPSVDATSTSPLWQTTFADVAEYLAAHGTIPRQRGQAIGTRSQHDLTTWTNAQRTGRRKGTLDAERARQLDTLPGWKWNPIDDTWQAAFDDIADLANNLGRLPRSTERGTRTGYRMGRWMSRQQTNHARGALSADRARQLETLPEWAWLIDNATA